MTAFCTISGLVLDPQGSPVAGAAIRISRAVVDNAIDATYHTGTTSSATGAFSFTVPQGARIRFAANDISPLDGFNYTAPNNVAVNLGNFRVDTASELGARSVLGVGAIPSAVEQYVTVREVGDVVRQLTFTLTALPVTLVKNGTSSGGGGTQIYTFPVGLIQPVGGSSNLTIAADGDASFLASVGHAAADTGGSLSSTEISFLPSTAATTSSGAGTCKMKGTSTTPTPGAHLDGTSTAIPVYLNAALNADATDIEDLTFSGTITITVINHGDN